MNVCYACSQLTFDKLKILTIFHTPMPTNVVHTVDTGYFFYLGIGIIGTHNLVYHLLVNKMATAQGFSSLRTAHNRIKEKVIIKHLNYHEHRKKLDE